MALTNDGMQVMANALRTAMVAGQLHSADPGADGVGLEDGARFTVTWNAVSGDGDFDLATAVPVTGLTASGPITHISFWSQTAAGGTCYGVSPLTGDQAANAAGEYTLNEVTVNGTAT